MIHLILWLLGLAWIEGYGLWYVAHVVLAAVVALILASKGYVNWTVRGVVLALLTVGPTFHDSLGMILVALVIPASTAKPKTYTRDQLGEGW